MGLQFLDLAVGYSIPMIPVPAGLFRKYQQESSTPDPTVPKWVLYFQPLLVDDHIIHNDDQVEVNASFSDAAIISYIYIYIHICIYLFMYLCIALFLCTKYKPYTSWLSTAHCTSNYKNVISHDIRTLSPFIFPNILITHYSHYIPWISPWISPFMMLNTQGTTNIDVENDCLSVRKMIYKCVASHMGSHIELLVYSSVIPITIW